MRMGTPIGYEFVSKGGPPQWMESGIAYLDKPMQDPTQIFPPRNECRYDFRRRMVSACQCIIVAPGAIGDDVNSSSSNID